MVQDRFSYYLSRSFYYLMICEHRWELIKTPLHKEAYVLDLGQVADYWSRTILPKKQVFYRPVWGQVCILCGLIREVRGQEA